MILTQVVVMVLMVVGVLILFLPSGLIISTDINSSANLSGKWKAAYL